ncbi:unnamed protein product [Soboliphyme baturini]|uniref:Uncharacterized protein n=1 Tax=Soboliphyme baturini TaxID=241478 RepID=A0A183IEP3_9BILA|nr:unnamed protein product [Soboliphyme baturini]
MTTRISPLKAGKELAKNYNCTFIEVSVILEHEVDTLVKLVLNSFLTPSITSPRKKFSFSLHFKGSKPKKIFAKADRIDFHMPQSTIFERWFGKRKSFSFENLS